MGRAVVVFDLDGTLSNPLEGFARSMNHALRLQGLPPREPHELARFIGPPLYDSAVELTGSADPTRHNRLIADYRQRYGESGYAENTLYDGIPEVLHDLDDGPHHGALDPDRRHHRRDRRHRFPDEHPRVERSGRSCARG